MSDPILFRIPVGESGTFALALVDRDAVGYSDSWQAPDGLRLPTVELSDYESDSGSWVCQVTNAALTATPNTTSTPRRGTFCAPPANTVTVGEDDFAIDLGYFQDPNAKDGLSRFLFQHRTKEAYVYFGGDGDDPPRAIGRVRLTSGNFGGNAYEDLTATSSMPLMRAPDIEFGTSGDSEVVRGDGLASVAVAGDPATLVPTGAGVPANLSALQASGIIPSPATAWTTGQNIILGDATTANWNGTAWEAGDA